MKYPIGIQNFDKVRTQGFHYVDKTDLIYRMENEGNFYFLSWPRRFGKSLLTSSLEDITRIELPADTLNSIDIMDENPIPLIYQSGHLTITGYDKRFGTYQLGFPNREVREGFIRLASTTAPGSDAATTGRLRKGK